MYEEFIRIFPNARPLSIVFYFEPKYRSVSYRRSKLIVLLGALSNWSEYRNLSIRDQDRILREIETGCLNKAISKCSEENVEASWLSQTFCGKYSANVTEIVNSLLHSDYIVRSITHGQNPKTILDLSYKELFPELKDKIEIADIRKNTVITSKTSALFTCPNCGKKESFYAEAQVRSLDEGKDIIHICAYCSAEWNSRC